MYGEKRKRCSSALQSCVQSSIMNTNSSGSSIPTNSSSSPILNGDSNPINSKKPHVQPNTDESNDSETKDDFMSQDVAMSEWLMQHDGQSKISTKTHNENDDDRKSQSVLSDSPGNQPKSTGEEGNAIAIIPVPPLPDGVCKQWKLVDPYFDFATTAVPMFIKEFLIGNLPNTPTQYQQVVDYLENVSNAKEGNCVIHSSLYLLEYILKLPSVTSVLKFYEAVKDSILTSNFVDLINSLVMQRLQEDICSPPISLEIPATFKNLLNHSPVVQQGFNRSNNIYLNQIDIAHLRKIEQIFLNIITINEIVSNAGETPEEDKRITVETAKRFSMSVIKGMINSLITDRFRSTYDTLIQTSIDENVGNVSHYLNAECPFRVVLPVRLHPYNASKHGIVPVAPHNIKTVKVSASVEEILTFQRLVHNDKPTSSDHAHINLHVYNMAKALCVPDIKNFLFRSTFFNTTTTPLHKDIVVICVKERYEELFDLTHGHTSWVLPEDKGNLLTHLDLDGVVWLLKGKNTPFHDEMEVYCALVNWTLHQHRIEPVVKEHFRRFTSPEIIKTFRQVYKYSLFLLNLTESSESLIEDGLIEREVIQAACSFFLKPTRNPIHHAIRRREDA